MELIEREMLRRRVKTECNPYGKPTIDFESGNKVLTIIDNEPAVDAVPVVRCKDCKHCLIDLSERQYHICMKRPIFRHQVELNEYCSYGERKAELNAEKGGAK